MAARLQTIPDGATGRLELVDRLRGLAMLLMLLDHARTFFVNTGFYPLDPLQTNLILYFTRWITYLAAPAFVFLAGAAVFLRLQKIGSRRGMAVYLLQRGLWLVVLEFTVVAFLWRFRLGPVFTFQVIGALGVGMLLLPLFFRLPRSLILVLALVILAGHNLLDRIPVSELPGEQGFFKLLHVYGEVAVTGSFSIRVSYPVLPWLGVLLLGFSLGGMFRLSRERLLKRFLIGGGAMLGLFVLLRLAGGYGNHYFFREHATLLQTLFSFFYCAKYPPSLVFLLLVFGLLSLIAGALLLVRGRFAQALWERVAIFGRVPLFFYLLHLFLLHTLAFLSFALLMGDPVVNIFDSPDSIGFPPGIAWLFFLLTTVALYPLCRFWAGYKKGKPWRHLI